MTANLTQIFCRKQIQSVLLQLNQFSHLTYTKIHQITKISGGINIMHLTYSLKPKLESKQVDMPHYHVALITEA